MHSTVRTSILSTPFKAEKSRCGKSFVSKRERLVTAHALARIWKEVAPEMMTRRLHAFSRYDTCVEFDEDWDGPLNAALRKGTLRRRSKHIQFVRASCTMSYATRYEAQLRTEITMSLVVDGTDQVRYALPHFASKSKASSSGLRVTIHLIRMLSHRGKSTGREHFLLRRTKF